MKDELVVGRITPLTNMSKEDMVQLVENLIRYGKVKPEDVEALAKHEPPREIKQLSEVLHTLLCQEQHGPGGCSYYDEIRLAELGPTVEKWIHAASYIINQLGESPETITRAFGAITQFNRFREDLSNLAVVAIQIVVRNTEPDYPLAVDEYIAGLQLRS